MTEDHNRASGLTPEEEARWDRAWEGATELDRRRFHRLHATDALAVMFLIPAGEAETLREATAMADGGFEEWMRERHGASESE